jgi:hypothetical protein
LHFNKRPMQIDLVRRILELVTGVAAFTALIVLCSVVAINQFKQRSMARVVVQGLEKGQQLPRLPAIAYKPTRATMLIALDTECKHCIEALTFYKEIARAAKPNLQVIAVFPNANKAVQQYAERHELGFATQSFVDLSQLNIAATPTLILVDNEARVIDFWIGGGSPDTQSSIIRTLSAL